MPSNGHHLWAERYERDLKDLFALQDDITMKILTAIQVKLTEGEPASRAEKYFKGKKGLDCYMKYLEATKVLSLNIFSIDGTRVGRRFVEEAIELCQENPMFYCPHERGKLPTSIGWALGSPPRSLLRKV